ncbi:hypothetical protein [Falsibacillus pallidus]|uniref:hypothetical protein n=1 Tax=Falsibacillus pallidus TaxID=493781 RepID=UPI003D95D5C5
MKLAKGTLIGMVFGFTFSFCISFLFMLFGQILAGGYTSLIGEVWLYYANLIPFILNFGLLGFYFTKSGLPSNKKLWLVSLFSACIVTLYSGTIGALFGEYVARGGHFRTPIDGGYLSVNVEGVLVWGTLYAFILLPLTTPLARGIIHIFIGLMKKTKLV